MWKVLSNHFVLSSHVSHSRQSVSKSHFRCNKILKLSDQYKLQVSKYIFQLSHTNIDEEIESSLLVNNQIYQIPQGPTTNKQTTN